MFWTKKRKSPRNGKKARSAAKTANDGLEALRRSRSGSPSNDFVPATIDPAEMRLMRADASGAGWARQSRQEVQDLPDDVHFNLPNEVVGTLSPSLARAHRLVPFRIEGKTLHVACDTDPSPRVTSRVEHELRVVAGLELSPCFRQIASAPLTKLVNCYYPPGETEPLDPASAEYDSSPFGELDAEPLDILTVDAGTLPSDFARKVIYAALLARAHDIRITSHPRYCRIAFIIDGLGMFYGKRLPRSAARSLSNIFKTWCGVPAATTHKTIKSSFQRNMLIDGKMRHIVARALFQPAPGDDGAETVVIRLHGRSGRYLITGFPYTGSDENVAWLDVDPRARREIASIIRDDNAGLICCVGPMGNGKSTLLTAIIEAHNREVVPISTIEDPPEFFPDDVHQIEFDERNNTYAENVANLLRSAARKTVVSEARDKEVVRLLEEHSLSAQQIFTTFHADDSVLAFERLRQLKYSVTGMASIRSVFAMRLIPKLCGCAVTVNYNPQYLRGIGFTDDLIARSEFRRPVGCPACIKGHSGRVAIIETLRVNERIRDLFRQAGMARKSHWPTWLGRIRAAALDDGLVPLRVLACAQAAAGMISVDHAVRSTPWSNEATYETSDSAAFSQRMLSESRERILDARRLLAERSADDEPFTENPDITGPMRPDEVDGSADDCIDAHESSDNHLFQE